MNNQIELADAVNYVHQALDEWGATCDNIDNIVLIGQSLSLIEDYVELEDSLGINLVELFQAKEIYVRFQEEIQVWEDFLIDTKNKKVYYGLQPNGVYALSQPFTNYRKEKSTAWALTREGLNN